MARNSYRSSVRVGNWYETRLMEEEQRKSVERSMSAEKSFLELSAALLEEGDVSVCPDGLLHFGDSVLMHFPTVQPHKGLPTSSFPCTISATPTRAGLIKNQYDETPLTAHLLHHQPIIKNVFSIVPRRSSNPRGSVLCFGDAFDLVHTTVNGERLYVTSPVGSALHSGRESRRQEVLLKPSSGPHSAWRLQPADPEMRITYDGQPIEVGFRCRLLQSMTNQPMVVEEEFSVKTIFDQEQEVSVGVVNRATTRASSTVVFLTWTRRTPEHKENRKTPEPQDFAPQEEETRRTPEPQIEQEDPNPTFTAFQQDEQPQEVLQIVEANHISPEKEKIEIEETDVKEMNGDIGIEEKIEGLGLVLDKDEDSHSDPEED